MIFLHDDVYISLENRIKNISNLLIFLCMGILWYWMPLSQRLPVSVCEAAPISISRSAAALRQRGSVLTFAIGRFLHHTHTAFHWTGHKPAHVIGPDGALLATKFSRRSPAAPTHRRNAYKTEIAPPPPLPLLRTRRVEEKKKRFGASRGRR